MIALNLRELRIFREQPDFRPDGGEPTPEISFCGRIDAPEETECFLQCGPKITARIRITLASREIEPKELKLRLVTRITIVISHPLDQLLVLRKTIKPIADAFTRDVRYVAWPAQDIVVHYATFGYPGLDGDR